MDAWVNNFTQQRGPSVDRILEKGIPVFPKLASLAVDSTVEFYDKLQKTSALFLLPLMPFDSINLHMGFKGLCSPGLDLPWYAKIASVLVEVLPRLLPDVDSQVTSLVTVVQVELNNGYDLLWWVLELIVPGVDPSLQLSAPIWMGEISLTSASCSSYILDCSGRGDSTMTTIPRVSHSFRGFRSLHMWMLSPLCKHTSTCIKRRILDISLPTYA
jgi:hypothetical protein